MRGPHLQSQVTHQLRGHVTNQKRYISTFARPMDPKLSMVMTIVRRPHPQIDVKLQYHGHLTNKQGYISTITKPMDPELSRIVT